MKNAENIPSTLKNLAIFSVFLCAYHPATGLAGNFSWNGFAALSAAVLPSTIEKTKIEKTTFQIETVGSNETPLIVVVPENQGNPLIGKSFGTKEYYQALQIQNCIQQKMKLCPLFKKVFISTGFAVATSATLATALHVLHDWKIHALKVNPGRSYAELSAPLLLINHSGDHVYNSVTSSTPYSVQFMNRDRRLHSQLFPRRADDPLFALFRYSDYIEISFSKPLFEQFLERATTAGFTEAEQFYCFGYPIVSEFYSIFNVVGPKPYPEDGTLTASTGTFWAQDKSYFGISCASMRGQSGGPALNAAGKVVGVLSGGNEESRPHFEYSLFIDIDHKRLVEIWNNL